MDSIAWEPVRCASPRMHIGASGVRNGSGKTQQCVCVQHTQVLLLGVHRLMNLKAYLHVRPLPSA